MAKSESIRWFFAKLLKDSVILNSLYNRYYRIKNKKAFTSEIEKRKIMPVFEIEKLASELPYYPIEEVKDSNFYGYAYHIKQYAGVQKCSYAFEHGLYNDDYIMPHNNLRTTHGIITFNEIRRKLLIDKTGKPAIAIGPYIHYAESLLSEQEINAIKQSLGKTLLFFPSHSCVEGKAVYNEDNIVNEIKQFAELHGFDTVLVNLFYHDVLYSSYADSYRKSGFKLTTAGHRYDINFISRLKSIIMLSDYVVANDFGTNIGYCVYLKKPLYILQNNMLVSKTGMFREIGEAFTTYYGEITEEQYNICAKYWGFDSIKDNEELKLLIN